MVTVLITPFIIIRVLKSLLKPPSRSLRGLFESLEVRRLKGLALHSHLRVLPSREASCVRYPLRGGFPKIGYPFLKVTRMRILLVLGDPCVLGLPWEVGLTLIPP